MASDECNMPALSNIAGAREGTGPACTHPTLGTACSACTPSPHCGSGTEWYHYGQRREASWAPPTRPQSQPQSRWQSHSPAAPPAPQAAGAGATTSATAAVSVQQLLPLRPRHRFRGSAPIAPTQAGCSLWYTCCGTFSPALCNSVVALSSPFHAIPGLNLGNSSPHG